jgi:Leucine-rich repeat (LRR) protein
MKRIIPIILIIFAFFLNDISAIGRNNTDNGLAIRNLKLANSYREGKNYDKALKLLNSSIAKFENKSDWNSKYWLATTYEYLGYVNRDIKKMDEARVNFEKALKIYRALIKQKDGSQWALDDIIKNIENAIDSIDPFSGNIKGANVVNYDNLKLKELPQDIPKNATNISFADNKFKEFPAGLSNYKNIRYLSLKNNKLTGINESLYDLKNLTWLDLSKNKIKKVNPGFRKLTNLKVLDLSNNKLKDIPLDIIHIQNLKVLNLKGNKIPFDKIKNLIKSMPNTNIMHDIYVLQPEEEEEEVPELQNE